MSNQRIPEFPVDNLFIERRSLRSLSGESISQEDLMSLFEAAKWAPSSYNEQPWRFLYAHRDTPEWDMFFNFLVPVNQEWASRAGALVAIIARRNLKKNDQLNDVYAFDTGAAWENMVLQGDLKGFCVHGIGGFDRQKASRDLLIPEGFEILCMASVGKPSSDISVLSARWAGAEQVPTQRKSLSTFVAQGVFVKEIE